jgi:hypothetical protein
VKAQATITVETVGEEMGMAEFLTAVPRQWHVEDVIELLLLGYVKRLHDQGIVRNANVKVSCSAWKEEK